MTLSQAAKTSPYSATTFDMFSGKTIANPEFESVLDVSQLSTQPKVQTKSQGNAIGDKNGID
jgi:hypothetical protein